MLGFRPVLSNDRAFVATFFSRPQPRIRMTRTIRSWTVAVMLFVSCMARADDLDVVVDPAVGPKERGEAYRRLMVATFPTIGKKLATLIGKQRFSALCRGANTAEPWNEARLENWEQVFCTLSQLWFLREKHSSTSSYAEELAVFLDILEEKAVGKGRVMPLSAIKSRLNPHTSSAMVPGLVASAVTRLEPVALDESEENALRLGVVELLFAHGDPNKYLDLAISLSNGAGGSMAISEAFRFSTPTAQKDRLTVENRKKFWHHAMKLLVGVDDGKSGHGYFLASHIGAFAGVAPVRGAHAAFVPDQRLPQYQSPNGLSESFFQDTVKNARKWWEENKGKY